MSKILPYIGLIIVYNKIKKRNKGNIIKKSLLKEIIIRNLICSQSYGGSKRGVPMIYLPEVFEDMINASLIKRINHSKYLILKNNCEKRLKKFPF